MSSETACTAPLYALNILGLEQEPGIAPSDPGASNPAAILAVRTATKVATKVRQCWAFVANPSAGDGGMIAFSNRSCEERTT
jgi:hypothetical protein